MNEILQRFVTIAVKEIGVREGAINNTGAQVVEYQGATWLAPGAWPWCAAFTAWVMREWLEDEEVRKAYNFPSFSSAEKWRCRDASAFGWEKWAVSKGLKVLPETALAKAGDLVIFDFSHIGIVIADQETTSSPIKTVEGNTNGKGERDSTTGDGVWQKSRVPSLSKCYLRLMES